MKKFILLSLCLSLFLIGQAQVSKTVTVNTVGTLSSALTATELNTVTNLTIIGNIDARDFKTLRDNMPVLAVLNMSAVSVKAYIGTGGTYFVWGNFSNNSSAYIESSCNYLANEIPSFSFYDGNQFKSIINNELISNIDKKSKKSLTTIILPNSITSISYQAFQGCSGLININIPNSVITISDFAFSYCTGALTATIGNGVTSIGSSAFTGCVGLTTAPIGTSVTTIGANAFDGCSKIANLTIPNSVIGVGDGAFKNCVGLTSITMGTGTTQIRANVFNSCTNLTSLNLGSGVVSIGTSAFGFCTGLTSLNIPNNIRNIGTYAFEFCTGLTTANIGTDLSIISEGAFLNCSSVKAINCKNIVPPAVGLNGFVGVPLSAVVTVPAASLAAYKSATGWKDFLNNIIKGDNPYIKANIGVGGILSENSVLLHNGDSIIVVSGTTKTFTITPDAGFQVATLTFDGVDVKSQIKVNQYTTPAVTASKTLAVTFKKIMYRLSLKSAESGTMNLAIEYGSKPVFDFTPSANWKVNTVFFNNVDVTSSLIGGVYTMPAITGNGLLNVSFVTVANGLPEVMNSRIKVYSTNSEIIVDGTSEGESVSVYTINGELIKTVMSNGEKLNLRAHRDAVYLVKTGEKTFKVRL